MRKTSSQVARNQLFSFPFLKNEPVCGLIDNRKVKSKKTIPIISPATLKPNGELAAMDAATVTKAFASAANAQKQWALTPWSKRKQILTAFARLLMKNRFELAKLMANHIAKSVKDGVSEVVRSADYIKDTIKIYEQVAIKPLEIGPKKNGVSGKTGYYWREPVGVVLAITPFNYPINTPVSKIAPALLAGNAVVFKPATQGGAIGVKMTELLIEAGIPRGVFQCIIGLGRDIGSVLTSDPHINAISFTGGTKIGLRMLKESAVGNIVLELGGKDAAIVLRDADVELAAKEIIKGAFSYSGQRCTAIKRVLVHKSIATKIITALKARIEEMTVGHPAANPDIVPVIDLPTAEFVQGLIDDAVKRGAQIAAGGRREQNLIWPTLLTDVTEKMRIAWEEPFGPVLPVLTFTNLEDAIRIHNASEYGLQASVFSADQKAAERLVPSLEVGTVNWNRATSRGPDVFPFLGVKHSGCGVQGIKEAIWSCTKYKGFVVNE